MLNFWGSVVCLQKMHKFVQVNQCGVVIAIQYKFFTVLKLLHLKMWYVLFFAQKR